MMYSKDNGLVFLPSENVLSMIRGRKENLIDATFRAIYEVSRKYGWKDERKQKVFCYSYYKLLLISYRNYVGFPDWIKIKSINTTINLESNDK